MDRPLQGKESRRPRSAPGVISVHEVYTIDEARARLRWSEASLRAAKRRGLQLLSSGKRRYLTGQEILRFLQSQSGDKSFA